MKKIRLALTLLTLFIAPTVVDAQDVTTMLNAIGNVFNTRQADLYDQAEDYLNSLSKDSIEVNLGTEILFHANMANLYVLKYNDWDKSNKELEFILNKVKPVKHLPEFSDPYKMLLSAYGYSLLNSGQADKAISYFNKILVEDFDDEYDARIYNAYYALANIYAKNNEMALSEDCHNKCQDFLIKSYIRNHPEHSFYLDNYNSIKDLSSRLEKQNKTNTVEYINNLCSLGYLLHKVDQGEFWESLIVLQKAHKCAIENGLLKIKGLEECYVSLQDIYIKYIPEPTKTQLVEELIPYLIDYFSGTLTPEDIYESIAASYGANQQYEKAIEFEQKVLNSIEKDPKNNKEKLLKIYQNLVMDYLGCSTDSANQIAYDYLQKSKTLITERDTELYEWFLVNKGVILRYLYKTDEAVQCFKNNLLYFSKKYGKESDNYISTLNQLALCSPYETKDCLSYLLQAKSLIANSKDVKESTIRGVCINLARHYILNGHKEQAKDELNTVINIENKIFGYVLPITQDLINQSEGQ